MKVLTFSQYFPKTHPKAGQPTHFIEKIMRSFITDGIEEDKSGFADYWCELVADELITVGIDSVNPNHPKLLYL